MHESPPLGDLLPAPLLLDGATGTMLHALGHPRAEPSEQAVLQAPETVTKIHAAYREAGARLLTTVTFQAHRLALERRALADRLEAINREAVALARGVAAGAAYVVGSIGPPGRLLSTLGDGSFREAVRAYREQIAILQDAGVDGFSLETFTDLLELQAALEAARDVTRLPVLACIALVAGPVAERRLTPGAAAQLAEAMGAAAVGVNCIAPADAARAIAGMRAATRLPLVARPSAGLPEPNGDYPVKAEEFRFWGERLLDAGGTLLGGCCGTTPAHIAALRPLFWTGGRP